MIDIKKIGDRVVSWPDGTVRGTVVQIVERYEVHEGLLFVGGDLLIVKGDDGEEHRAPTWMWWKEELVPETVLSKNKPVKEELNNKFGLLSIGVDLSQTGDKQGVFLVDVREAEGRQSIDCRPMD